MVKQALTVKAPTIGWIKMRKRAALLSGVCFSVYFIVWLQGEHLANVASNTYIHTYLTITLFSPHSWRYRYCAGYCYLPSHHVFSWLVLGAFPQCGSSIPQCFMYQLALSDILPWGCGTFTFYYPYLWERNWGFRGDSGARSSVPV